MPETEARSVVHSSPSIGDWPVLPHISVTVDYIITSGRSRYIHRWLRHSFRNGQISVRFLSGKRHILRNGQISVHSLSGKRKKRCWDWLGCNQLWQRREY